MTDRVKEIVDGIAGKLVQYRRDFHKHPESGWTEFRTTSIIASKLKELGYEIKLGKDVICKESMMGVPSEQDLELHMKRAVEQGADPELVQMMKGGLTGVVGELKCGEGPVMALRFDIDSNDISEVQDESHFPYREGFVSINQNAMHACGHDGHASIGLGVAEVLTKLKDQIKGTVRIIFQPGEEGVRGAGPMVDAGVVDGVDFILGGHIGFRATKTGQFICSTDKFLATTKFDVTFTGVPAHAGGAPEAGKNALLAAAAAALNLHAIPRHGEGASRITVGVLNAGQGRNVIPPNALIKVETRGETSEIDDFMFESAKNVIDGAAKMYGVKYDLKLMGKTKSGESDAEMMEIVKKIAESMDFFDKNEIIDKTNMGGSEDYSHMMTAVQKSGGKGTFVMFGSELTAGHHDYHFNFDESCLAPGVELYVRSVLNILS
ncbi:amidohydrolase [Denitrovibrio acetiphilus DSM 12809]|uniref:Amidohydrolase n=1 Tax=Denitrovibrio acetiphilus (strain DSM 12809 / NBRC 114555 / N2460) TaxID=522772 RepID=D4H1R3_DENA2|nr:amidohydrolase [Denitrovibrio acetiphilus]ADD68823.1 amidohydrolase [Denitrovibrio acetiphilus DSM 12809]